MKTPITETEKECVRDWLNEPKPADYPFYIFECEDKNKKPYLICKSWFSKINDETAYCPCLAYKLSTVISRARRMIK